MIRSQIGGKWALDLHFTLLLIPFKYRKRAKEVHPSGSVIQAEKKGTSSVALQVPFWATWVDTKVGADPAFALAKVKNSIGRIGIFLLRY